MYLPVLLSYLKLYIADTYLPGSGEILPIL